jgi:uncharacterized repeat protein (TIGR01451 family)
LAAPQAQAQPLDSRQAWEGTIDYFATGAPLAIDTADSGTDVDQINQPESVEVTTTDVPSAAFVVAAYLYWAGTIPDQTDCATAPSETDDQVDLTDPSGATTTITADVCYCAAGAGSYDIQGCRADITTIAETAGMIGTWTVDGFAALIRNSSTDNASFAIVLVYEEPTTLPPRRIGLYDGLEEFSENSRTLTLGGLDADTPAHGELTWYVLDGDEGGTGLEQVQVMGEAGASTILGDAYNPLTNPMNRTINTTVPVQTGIVGVDIDQLDISGGLTPGDTSVDMTYTAGTDKYWVVFNIVGINVYRAVIQQRFSNKTWALQLDADSNGAPTPGDTIRYTIHLDNVGTAPGFVTVTDDIPSQASSWAMVDAAGGTDISTATTLIVQDIPVAAGGTADVRFDVVLASGTLAETMNNQALFDAGPDGNAGALTAPPVYIGVEDPPDDPADTTEPALDTSTDTSAPDIDEDMDASIDLPADTDNPDTGTDVLQPPGGGKPSVCTCSVPGLGTPSSALVMLMLVLGALQLFALCCKLIR